MAPGFESLSDHDFDDEEEIDFSDLHQQFDVRMEEGLDAFVVIDGLPSVPDEKKPQLIKYLLKRISGHGHKTSEDAIFMPMNEKTNMSEGFAFVEYNNAAEAALATRQLHGTGFDKKHTMSVNKLTDIEKYGREGRIDDQYEPPEIPPFEDKEHLRYWLGDSNARDQFVMFRGDKVGVYWNQKRDTPEMVVDRPHWTQIFVQWSPQGTYLTSVHQQGVQLWGGPSFNRVRQLAHPFVSLIEYSPGETYLTTWSNQPIEVDENMLARTPLTLEEDGKHIIIWDLTSGKPLRSFVAHDLAAPIGPDGMALAKPKPQWPAFKWSADEKYVARMKPGESISVYELPRMNLLDKTSIKIEQVQDFDWAPTTPQRDGVKTYEQLLCYWTPEIGSNPAKVGLMSIPSKEVVRTKQMFNVTDAKMHWQSDARYICVKIDRHSKSKKSMATSLEIFRIREKGVPVEVVENIRDIVINFAWEPKGDRFVLITAGEAVPGSNVAPKTSVSFYCPEKVRGPGTGNFKLIRTVDKQNSNGIYWSPKGRFVVIATVSVQTAFDLKFWDLDYEGEKPESDANLSANLMLMNEGEHYGVTDIEWDPTGRYVVTGASVWTHTMENGYKLWTFSGQQLADVPTEKFKQFIWRPRPPTLLSKDEQRNVRRNLREYSREFEEMDREMEEGANQAVIESRRRVYREWYAWLEEEKKEVAAEREEFAVPDPLEELELQRTKSSGGAEADQVVEEVVDELIEETEEIVS